MSCSWSPVILNVAGWLRFTGSGFTETEVTSMIEDDAQFVHDTPNAGAAKARRRMATTNLMLAVRSNEKFLVFSFRKENKPATISRINLLN